MSSIVIFGAAGKAGRLLVNEAAQRGHQVTAVVRNLKDAPSFPSSVKIAKGDATDGQSVRSLAAGADAFIVAIGGTDTGVWLRAVKMLAENLRAMPGKIPRILHMGGGATLLTPDGKRFLDLPHFPEEFRGAATGQAEALNYYRTQMPGEISWTYFSLPPVEFAPGQRTGKYRTGLDHPVQDKEGHARLSYEDFAVALIDEVEHPHFINKRFTAGY